jgi:pyruvate dehydrogenase E2 component (dihydrolipoamide acetyltransferase)
MSPIFTVTFPDIGEGVVEGEVIEWRKNVGDSLSQDEAVVVIMTDKATVELPAPHPGILAKQYYAPGGIAIKDQPLYDIQLSTDGLTHKGAKEKKPATEVLRKVSAPAPSEASKVYQAVGPKGKALATPKVRGLAKELGLPIDEIRGTGKEGRITTSDLSQKIKGAGIASGQGSGAPTPFWRLPGDEELPVIGIKALMARRMAESKAQIPHFSYFEQVDATRLIQLRTNIKSKASDAGVHLTYMPFIIKALSLCIQKFPLMNSSFDKDNSKVIIHHQQNIGIAVASTHGLIVPVLKSVKSLALEPLIRSYEELVQKAHNGKLSPSDMKEATITVSNFGSHGGHGLWATPVINFPEVAILAIGRIHQQPVAREGQVVLRDVVNLSWSFDHRIIDGEMATQISHCFCSFLENPAALL